jgi:hypothetical protein
MDKIGTKHTSSKVGKSNPVGVENANCPKGFGNKAGKFS